MKTLTYKTVLITLLILFHMKSPAQAYGEIRGIIKDTELEPVPFAIIKVLQGNSLVGGTQSNAEGRYNYKPLTPGTYEIVVIDPGHVTQPVNKIKIIPNEATYVDVKLAINTLTDVVITAEPINYLPVGVDKHFGLLKTFDALELKQNAGYSTGDIKGALPALTSEVIEGTDGEMHFRGARGDASGYFVDGVRTLHENIIPGLAIENITILSGGIPANYGDVTSGVVIITTKTYFSGIRDKNIRTSEFREEKREEKAREKARQDEENRLKEIEEQRSKEKFEN